LDPELKSLQLIFLSAINISTILSFLLLFILLFCSALISGAEVAIFSLTKLDIEDEAADKRIEVVSVLLERPKNY